MTKKVAINGFGRIGRIFFRQAFGSPDIEIVAINDLGDLSNLAYLLKYDSVYRQYQKDIKFDENNLIIDGKKIIVLKEKDPAALPWGKLGIDIVIESTGFFEEFTSAKAHLRAGAKHVIISAPAKDDDGPEGKTILMGVNDSEIKGVALTSNGSCTTNAASPVIQIMHETIGIQKAFLSTTHAYTATQSLVDGPTKGKDFRRGRGAAQNIAPSTTGSAISVARAIPELLGKFDGLALRVPIAAGSVADITFLAKRKTTVEEVNKILRDASQTPRWQGILAVSDEQLVSSDIIGMPYGAVVDTQFTKVVDGDLVKVLSWYDNEWGYVSTLVRHVAKVAEII